MDDGSRQGTALHLSVYAFEDRDKCLHCKINSGLDVQYITTEIKKWIH